MRLKGPRRWCLAQSWGEGSLRLALHRGARHGCSREMLLPLFAFTHKNLDEGQPLLLRAKCVHLSVLMAANVFLAGVVTVNTPRYPLFPIAANLSLAPTAAPGTRSDCHILATEVPLSVLSFALSS